MIQKIRWFLLLLGGVLLVIVAFQNDERVPLKILLFSDEYPLTLLILATTMIGMLVGSLMTVWTFRTKKKKDDPRRKPAGRTADRDPDGPAPAGPHDTSAGPPPAHPLRD